MARPLAIALAIVGSGGTISRGELPITFAATSGQVLRLIDLNGDEDFFGFSEVLTYADGLPSGLGAIALGGATVFVVAPATASVHALRDLNGDGDALDFAEALLFAPLPAGTLSPVAAGLARDADGSLYVLDSANGVLYRVHDINGDADALDFTEVICVATGLSSPVAVSLRSDGLLLVAQNDAAIPVRILRDRNGDGDFLDFAENLSYGESFAPGIDIVCATTSLSFLARVSDGSIVKLIDLTGDDDVLDFAEVQSYAAGLTGLARVATTGGGLLAGASDFSGSLYRVTDLNGDGDALDFNETLLVGQAGAPILGLATASAALPVCMKGDVNFDTAVNHADVGLFSDIVIGAVIPADPCPADVNDDGLIDGRDIGAFLDEVFP